VNLRCPVRSLRCEKKLARLSEVGNLATETLRPIRLALSLVALGALAACATHPPRPQPQQAIVPQPAAPPPAEPAPPPPPPAPEAQPAALAPAQYADLFDRIRTGFIIPDPEQTAIDQQLNWYASNPEY